MLPWMGCCRLLAEGLHGNTLSSALKSQAVAPVSRGNTASTPITQWQRNLLYSVILFSPSKSINTCITERKLRKFSVSQLIWLSCSLYGICRCVFFLFVIFFLSPVYLPKKLLNSMSLSRSYIMTQTAHLNTAQLIYIINRCACKDPGLAADQVDRYVAAV